MRLLYLQALFRIETNDYSPSDKCFIKKIVRAGIKPLIIAVFYIMNTNKFFPAIKTMIDCRVSAMYTLHKKSGTRL